MNLLSTDRSMIRRRRPSAFGTVKTLDGKHFCGGTLEMIPLVRNSLMSGIADLEAVENGGQTRRGGVRAHLHVKPLLSMRFSGAGHAGSL